MHDSELMIWVKFYIEIDSSLYHMRHEPWTNISQMHAARLQKSQGNLFYLWM